VLLFKPDTARELSATLKRLECAYCAHLVLVPIHDMACRYLSYAIFRRRTRTLEVCWNGWLGAFSSRIRPCTAHGDRQAARHVLYFISHSHSPRTVTASPSKRPEASLASQITIIVGCASYSKPSLEVINDKPTLPTPSPFPKPLAPFMSGHKIRLCKPTGSVEDTQGGR
jgi:hypothetical protein